MQMDEIFHLAERVHALLPSTRVAPGEPWEPATQYVVSDDIDADADEAEDAP